MDTFRIFEDDEHDSGLSFRWHGSATINVYHDGREVDVMTRYGQDEKGQHSYTPTEGAVEEACRDYVREAVEGPDGEWR